MNNLIVKDATENDAPIIAELIYATEDYPEHIWGQGTKEEIIARIIWLIKNEESRYSYKNIRVATVDNNICGAIILIKGDEILKLDILTSLKLVYLIKGVARKSRFLLDIMKGLGLNEAKAKELYIANVAILQEFRGKGIGKYLMEKAEQEAKEKGYNVCSLLAKDKNVKNFYERLNYVLEEEEVYFSHVLYRMIKTV